MEKNKVSIRKKFVKRKNNVAPQGVGRILGKSLERGTTNGRWTKLGRGLTRGFASIWSSLLCMAQGIYSVIHVFPNNQPDTRLRCGSF